MARTMVLTCDVCGSSDTVREYGIGQGSEVPYDVDLCVLHAQPLVDLMEVGRKRAAGLIGQTSHASQEPQIKSKIYDPEELDRLEEEYRRKHAES